MDPADVDERTDGDTRRSTIGRSVRCMSDVNVVPKWAGTILNDCINSYF
jgi:hypothetical protein